MEASFTFNGYDIDEERGKIGFNYIVKLPNQSLDFIEKLTFPIADFSKIPQELLKNLLNNLSLILGISYWKLYCPKKIEIKDNFLTKEQAEFWNRVYTKGLGEFFYRNKINFRGLVKFSYVDNHQESNEMLKSPPRRDPAAAGRVQHDDKRMQDRSFLMLGGGKDSIVAAELLKENNKDFTAFVVNDYPIRKEIIKLMGVDSIIIKREIDPKLLELNKREDTFNGHVPISAIYAFIALLAAAVYDYKYVISSNEASSNYGNVEYLGEMINHQWSKSMEFEILFADYVKKYLTSNIYYFSLLRPLYEIKIAQLFTKYPKYFSTFSSCNRNFTIQKFTSEESSSNTSEVAARTPRMVDRWCGKCPKCAFIFASLAAFLQKDQVVKIVGKNLFADESLMTIYQELLGVKNVKPFECVGTPEEVKLAFYLAHKNGEFNEDITIQMFEKEILPTMKRKEQLEKELLINSKEHRMPEVFVSLIQ